MRGSIMILALLCASPALAQQKSDPAAVEDATAPAVAPTSASMDEGEGERVRLGRPEAARRLVRLFDFEEQDFNREPVPRHWVRALHDPPRRARPGFPRWNESAFDNAASVSGEYSVKTPTSGGSAALRLVGGVLPALPGGDYVVSAKVRTSRLQHARARLSARFLDEHLQPIAESESAGPLLRTDGKWIDTSVPLIGDFESVAWIQIDLELLQPAQQSAGGASPHEALLEDVSGAAWFDDVAVFLLPRVELTTTSHNNIVLAPAEPELLARVQDQAGELLRCVITLTDIDNREVARTEFTAPTTSGGHSWRPPLDAFGWSHARLDVYNDDGLVGGAEVTFVWMPPPRPGSPAESERFAVAAESVTPQELARIPDLLEKVGAGSVHLSIWREDMTPASFRAFLDLSDSTFERLFEDGRRVTMSLARVPAELALGLRIAPDRPLDLVGKSEQDWSAFLDPALARYGQRIHRWKIGRSGDEDALRRRSLLDHVHWFKTMLSRLAPAPTVVLPLSAVQSVSPEIASQAALDVHLPYSAPASGIEEYSRAWEGAGAEDLTLLLESPPPMEFGKRAGVAELMKRTVIAWKSNAPGLSIERPWDWRGDPRPQIMPDPRLAVWRTLIESLADRRVVDELPIAEGVTALVLDGPAGGAIVAWNDFAQPERAVLRAFLTDGPVRVVDAFGNERPVLPVNNEHEIVLGTTPVFIEDIDLHLARFRAGFRVEPGSISPVAAKRRLEVGLTNPWPVTISGKLRVVRPEEWRVSPRVLTFTIAPDGDVRMPVEASFGVAEEAGVKEVEVEMELSAGKDYPLLRLTTEIDVGLPGVELTPAFRFIPGPDGRPTDLSVTLLVTNIGDDPVTMNAYAIAPGFPREQAPVSRLQPGSSIVKRFVFRDGAAKLRGHTIRVGLIDVDQPRRLNKSLSIP